MIHIEDILLYAVAQRGKPYLLGAEAAAADPDPPKFDCSELLQWSGDRAGVDPPIPDGAYWQYKHCENYGLLIPVAQGIATRGAALFRLTRNPPTRFDDVPHVAISAGGGMTVEARGRAWGVGSWASAGRFQAAGLIPGVDYSPGHGQLPFSNQENDMPTPVVRRLAINPDDPSMGYVLDASGGIHPLGNAKPVTDPDAYYDKSQGGAMDLVIVDWSVPSGYTLTAKGDSKAFGGAPVLVDKDGGPYWQDAFVPPAPAV